MVGGQEPLLVLQDICKEFPGVKALDGVSLEIFPGEIHAVLGENGAGKSTLMKILSGIIRKDRGEVILEGKRVDFRTPRDAISAGIALVQQELSLVPYLSVAENIFLGRWQRKGLGIDWKLLKKEAEELLRRFNLKIDPQVLVEELSVAEQQIVEIIKAIAKPQVQVFLLDEPTSALGEKEITRLFELLFEIKKEGKAIIFISHKINEASALSDRITVLRDGRKVITAPCRELTERDVVFHMTGKTWERQEEAGSVVRKERVAPILVLQNFSVDNFVRDVNLEIARGEILVIFGLVGSGRTTLAEGLFGLHRHAGKLFLEGKEIELSSPLEAVHSGIGYIPEDRRHGLIYEMPVFSNITLAILSDVSRRGILKLEEEFRLAGKFVQDLRIKTPNIFREVLFLSGGNQQKVLLARWLARNPRVLIMDEPTRGIDVGAKFEIRELTKSLALTGLGIIYITSEAPEALEFSSRIAVMRNGKIVAIFDDPSRITKSDLIAAASGALEREVVWNGQR